MAVLYRPPVGGIPSPQIVVPPAAMLRVFRYFARVVVAGAKSGTRAGTPRMRLELQGETRRALGTRMSRTWSRPRYFLDPKRHSKRGVLTAGLVGSKTPEIIKSNLSTGVIKPRRRKMLAIPLPAAGKRGRGRFSNIALTPEKYQRAFSVKLKLVVVPGKAPLLIDPEFRQVTARATGVVSRKRATPKQVQRGKNLIGEPVFVLVPYVRHKQTIDLGHVWDRTALAFIDEFEATVSTASVSFEQLPVGGGENPLP